jgi:hypothetical protein
VLGVLDMVPFKGRLCPGFSPFDYLPWLTEARLIMTPSLSFECHHDIHFHPRISIMDRQNLHYTGELSFEKEMGERLENDQVE